MVAPASIVAGLECGASALDAEVDKYNNDVVEQEKNKL